MNGKNYVIAGQYNHAQEVARAYRWSHHSWVYVHEPQILQRGVQPDSVLWIYTPTAHENPLYHSIMRQCLRLTSQHGVRTEWLEQGDLSGCRSNNCHAVGCPMHDPWGFPTTPRALSFREVQLRSMLIPASQVEGYRIAEHGNCEITIISVEPSNPNDRNGPWLVRYQERRP